MAFAVGFGGWVLGQLMSQRAVLRASNSEAKDILLQARGKANERMDQLHRELRERSEKAYQAFEAKKQVLEKKLNRLNEKMQPLRREWDRELSSQSEGLQRLRSQLGQARRILIKSKDQIQSVRQVIKRQQQQYVQMLSQNGEQDVQKVVDEWKHQLTTQAQQQAVLTQRQMDVEVQQQAEHKAKQLCLRVLQRFIRPSCNERGISPVTIKSKHVVQALLAQDKKLLSVAAKLCGVDFHYDTEAQVFHVYGFDPVRRELGRLVLNKLARRRSVSEREIERTMSRCQKSLFVQIQADGEAVARELSMRRLSPKVKNMMGALRYRYSFTQNQYFHCAEVGFLCGLLASELDLNVLEARRCGLLHDIGKAMDHSIEGGHAVIGADFIEKYGESAPVVHAVRAHHYDVPPESDVAFLVIAADALSGARPGARRSTVASYTQKVSDLEDIANSFKGVVQTQILSAGREVRVMVDTQQVSDEQGLKLSADIARQIEEKITFPGTIKVTVVRETQAMETALPRAS